MNTLCASTESTESSESKNLTRKINRKITQWEMKNVVIVNPTSLVGSFLVITLLKY